MFGIQKRNALRVCSQTRAARAEVDNLPFTFHRYARRFLSNAKEKNMKNKKLSLLMIVLFLLSGALTTKARNIYTENTAAGEDVILQWNRVLSETVAVPGQHPPAILSQRSFAMMHLAMFDAVNSIDRSYTPYLTELPGWRNSSVKAAAARFGGTSLKDAASSASKIACRLG
jgi:hypothetical protein